MIRVGVLGTAGIAERRMIPAMLTHPLFVYKGVAITRREEIGEEISEEDYAPIFEKKRNKAKGFIDRFGGDSVEGYEELLKREDIDAVYIPLPPALHFKWAMRALHNNKHVLMEKPFTISAKETEELVGLAKEKHLALIENYGFCLHRQMKEIKQIISEKQIGELRLIRTAFGFPRRDEADFRYSRKMGGGALLDCGGYTLRAAQELLDGPVEVLAACHMTIPEFDVDIGGSGMLRDGNGLCAQFSYGMDNAYKCELEIWGTKGLIRAPRIFTAPAAFEAQVNVEIGAEHYTITASDDQFSRILDRFAECIDKEEVREAVYREIKVQADLVERCSG